MIGYLKGRVIERTLQEVWVDVRDVGYRLKVGVNVMEGMSVGDEVELYVYTHVREDALELFGFADRYELEMFEVITSVSGIGPKIGLAVVGSARVEQIEKAIREADVDFFTRIPGIGKKGAQRIMVDLKGKLPRMKELDLSEAEESDEAVYQALMQFGFSKAEIRSVVSDMDEGMSEEEKIREGLKRLGR